MNKQKEAEMLEDIAFIKEHFKPDVTLPQSLQGQQLRRRLEHTKAVPKPALRPLYWKLAPMACAFALVLGLSVYAVSANGWSKQITAENNAMAMDTTADTPQEYMLQEDMDEEAFPEDDGADQPMLASQGPSTKMAAVPAGGDDEIAAADAGGMETQPFYFSISQETGIDVQKNQLSAMENEIAPVQESSSTFENYSQLQEALGQMQTQNKSSVHFGDAREYQPELYGRGETLEYTTHSLYIGIDPITGEEADLLYVTGQDRKAVEKEIQLPPQYMAELFLGKEEENIFALAAQEEHTSMMVMSLETYQGASYSQPGQYQQCFVKEGVLFVVTSMEVGQQALTEGEYIPYLVENGEKQLLPLEQIYSTGGSKPWYTVISRFSLDRQEPAAAVAILGGEASVSLSKEKLTVEDSQGEQLVFSAQNLAPIQ